MHGVLLGLDYFDQGYVDWETGNFAIVQVHHLAVLGTDQFKTPVFLGYYLLEAALAEGVAAVYEQPGLVGLTEFLFAEGTA